MNTPLRYLTAFGALALLALAVFFASSMHMASAATARVVDAETGQPVPDAIVLASWEMKGLEGYPLGPLAMFELTTDVQGAFTIPGWGPRWVTGFAEIRGSEPKVRIFRRDYLPVVVRNHGPASRFMKPSIDGAVIELQASREPPTQYLRELQPFLDSIQFLYWSGHCEWQRAPRTMLAIYRLKSELQDSDAARSLLSIDNIVGPPECGSGLEFFKAHLG